MKLIKIKNLLILFLFINISFVSQAQCDVLNRVAPDGSMQFYFEPVNFYWTNAKSLQGCIVTDGEHYFLELHPIPFPEKPAGNKLKSKLELKLANGQSHHLKHFDTRYVEKDTVMEMLYLIGNKDIDYLLNHEIAEVKIDMQGNEGIRTYVLKLHKEALMQQLSCFLEEKKSKKNK